MNDNEISDGEMWAAYHKERQAKRAGNREHATRRLREAGIPFTSHNDGAHLIVMEQFDLWPGTGKWKERGAEKYHRGVGGLIARIRAGSREGT